MRPENALLVNLSHKSTLIMIESGYSSFCPKAPVSPGFSAFKADLGRSRDRPFLHFGGSQKLMVKSGLVAEHSIFPRFSHTP